MLCMSKGLKVILTFDPFDIHCFDIPPNAMYVKGVESYFDFQPLQHASIYIALDGMVGKV